MTDRKYLPTFGDLVDRLSIVQLKEIFISEHKEEYAKERELIEQDITALFVHYYGEGRFLPLIDIVRAAMLLMLTNRVIWENEATVRRGGGAQDSLLRYTHSINGVRNTAKNKLNSYVGDRQDMKVDCLAADLPEAFGNWKVF